MEEPIQPATPVAPPPPAPSEHGSPVVLDKPRYQKYGAAIFGLFFAAIGSYFLLKTFAATPPPDPPAITYTRGEFGITPGSGFYLTAAATDPTSPAAKAAQDAMAVQLRDFEAMGVRWIRSSIPWGNIEPQDPGTGTPQYNWRGVDSSLVYMMNTYNNGEFKDKFRLILTVDGPPKWASNPAEIAVMPNCAANEQPPFDLEKYGQAVAALMAHLTPYDHMHVVELENSPNITPGVWPHANPCAYADLLKISYPLIHAARPGVVVLTAGIGGVKTTVDPKSSAKDPLYFHIAADTFIEDLYAQNGGTSTGMFDGVSFHAYSSPSLPCDPNAPTCQYDNNTLVLQKDAYDRNDGWDLMVATHNYMDDHGDTAKKIWITEFGATTPPPVKSQKKEDVPAAYAKDPQTVTDTYTNEQTAQRSIIEWGLYRAAQDEAEGWLGPICIYTYQDGTRDDHNGYNEGLKFLPGAFPVGTQLPNGLDQINKPTYTVYHDAAHNFATTPPPPGSTDDSEL